MTAIKMNRVIQWRVVFIETWVPFLKRFGKLFGLEKAFVKLQTAYCVKFRGPRRLRFKDTKRFVSLGKAPEKFRDFRETGP